MSQAPQIPPSPSSAESHRSSLEVVEEYLRCMREGDRNGLRDILSAHIEVRYFGPKEHLPWAGIFRGLRGFDEFVKHVIENLEILEAAELDRIVEGDRIVIIGRARWRVRATDRDLRARSVTIFRTEAGKIASYHIHTDSAAFVQAMRR